MAERETYLGVSDFTCTAVRKSTTYRWTTVLFNNQIPYPVSINIFSILFVSVSKQKKRVPDKKLSFKKI
ncbi:hypothetical protein LB467_17200 [Salegentibacter sp. JZCK2]|uniref:hypothetical protein n=1 Tax=Salegentibacter tibetensis TaxID=2873600 RepID=UPI001CCE6F37|nr:hypothetical protein [Salegentibacter tibetensis]MBZ9731427.1 hypothetical protein [Salegentibacter tibetensis]